MSSGTFYIDSLLSPDQFRWNSNAPGTSLTVSYGFMTAMPAYSSLPGFGFESPPFQAFTAAQQDAVTTRAVPIFESVANIHFAFRPDGDNAQIRFGSAVLDPGEAAHTYYPDPSHDYAGDVWFNSQDQSVYNQNAGSYGFMATLHEMGHALGLKHSFFDPDDPNLPYLLSDKDNRQYTVMSYNAPTSMSDVEPSSLMLYDIAALQYLYGANTSYMAGNDLWRWNPNETFRYCIWDGGGSDTLDASNQTRRVIINLNPGSFSSLGSYQGGDATDNLSIAYNCWIENAAGGSGNDTIYASQVANTITGNGGTDTVSYKFATAEVTLNFATGASTGYAAGDTFNSIEIIEGSDWSDTFIGGAGAAGIQLRGGFGYDTLIASSGIDRFDGGDGNDTVSYENSTSAVTARLDLGTISGGFATGDVLTSVENITGSNYNDTLIGNSDSNTLIGGLGDDYLDPGSGGADEIRGGLGNDTYVFNSANFVLTIVENDNEGIDTIRTDQTTFFQRWNFENLVYTGTADFTGYGTSVANRIEGASGADHLYGFDGNDTLVGGTGDDWLEGGLGADALDGGSGYDWASYENAGAGFNGITIDMANSAASTGEAAGDTFTGIEAVLGTAYDDIMRGDDGDNVFRGQAGNDTIDGRGGYDTAMYVGSSRDYEVTTQGSVTTVRSLRSGVARYDGVDTLIGVENIFFSNVVSNHAPVVNGLSRAPTRDTTLVFVSQLSLSDSDFDQIKAIEIRDKTAGAGYFILDGAVVASGQLISLPVDGSTDSRLQYHASPSATGIDQVEIRVSDGVDWSAWATLSVGPANFVPVVIPNYDVRTQAHGTASIAATSLFLSAYDNDGDPIRTYEFTDVTAGQGYFTVNGVAQSSQTFSVAAADIGNVRFVLGQVDHATSGDIVSVRVFDGYDWSYLATVEVGTALNAAPVVSATSIAPAHGAGFVTASSMFAVSDGDGDAITQYEFRDNTTGNGYFRLNGVQQAANFQIAANQLASLQFVPTSTAGGQDQIDVRAFDGYRWGNWKSFTVGAVPNAAPAVGATGAALTRGTTSISASALIATNDGDGDAMSRYRFFDGTSGNGRFALGSVAQAENTNIEITAAQLAGLQFTLGAPGTSDVVWAQVFDGFVWSNWTSFMVTAPANAAPAAVVSDRNPARGTSALAASSLFSASDADGDAITAYRFFDATSGNGHFRKNGIDQAEGTNIDVSAAELATTQFMLGAGSDVLWVQVYDGTSWSTWKSFTVFPPQNNAPVIAVNASALNPAKGTSTVAAASLFSVTDGDGDTITQYRFFDGNAGNGRLELNGNQQAELANITINASDLANFRYRTSTTGAGDTLWVQAFDGTSWGAWKSFDVAAPQNAAPIVAVSDKTPARGTATLSAASLFSVSDADGDTITAYKFFDGTAGNGRFRKSGIDQAEGTNISVSAAELGTTDFALGGGSDVLWVQAFDGTSWSAWKSFNVTAPQNNAPVVTINLGSLAPSRGTATIAASSFFSVSDGDGDAITQFRFFDGTIGNGRFELGGAAQVEQQNITVSAASLANFAYRTSTTGAGDTLWVQAFDGTSWGAWKSFNVAAPQNNAPVVTAGNRSVNANTAVAAASLFSVADGDGDTITKYQFWDSTPAGGAFRINGAVQQANANIDVMANQLAATDFLSAGAAATDQLWARAFDGTAWGEWKPFSVTTLAPA